MLTAETGGFRTKTNMNHHNNHRPVLLKDVLDLLDPRVGESYLDLTAGFGGHTRAILARTHAPAQAVLVDRDEQAIAALESLADRGVKLIHSDYLSALDRLAEQRFDLILMDLGVSSVHLDNSERGFSWRWDGPLDMRMDQRQTLSAQTMVNSLSEVELRQILRDYGEERRAARVAKAIVANRPFTTTSRLAKVVSQAVGFTPGKHPATRTFQALRIAVNDELRQLQGALDKAPHLLNPDGRLAIISFHSLEDRLVKQAFNELAGDQYDAEFRLVNAKPISGLINDPSNPRARSAKLRAVAKINNKRRR